MTACVLVTGGAGYIGSLFADSARAREILGWVPQHTGLEQIVASAWHWLQSSRAQHATM